MISAKEACNKAREFDEPSGMVEVALDFGKFYGFNFRPKDFPENEAYMTGPFLIAVDKRTGTISEYDITDNLMLYNKAKDIKNLVK